MLLSQLMRFARSAENTLASWRVDYYAIFQYRGLYDRDIGVSSAETNIQNPLKSPVLAGVKIDGLTYFAEDRSYLYLIPRGEERAQPHGYARRLEPSPTR